MVALFLFQIKELQADFTTRGLLGYLTDFHLSSDEYKNRLIRGEYPAQFSSDNQSYFEAFIDHQEALRSFSGLEKRVNHGLGSFSVKKMLSENAGVFAGFNNRSGSLTLPLSNNRIRIKDMFDANDVVISGFMRKNRISAGYTVGKTLTEEKGAIQAAQVIFRMPKNIGISVRWASTPYKWGVDAVFKGVSQTLFSQFNYNRFESELTYSLRGWGDLSLSIYQGSIRTPEDFRGSHNLHAQVWKADRFKREAGIHGTFLPGIAVSVGYSDEECDGNLGFWFAGARYLRGKFDIGTQRFSLGAALKGGTPYIPAVRYDRIFTNLEVRNGAIDSWPFTPKQMAIIGDKTWTFSGRGRFVSNALDFAWRFKEKSHITMTYLRVYPDYLLYITTRDHLSLNPWDMIFGKRRVETDGTQSYEFMSIVFGKKFTSDRFILDTEISQLVPLRHKKKSKPGNAPELPEFPRLRFEQPKKFGGLSFYGSIRYPF